MPVDVEYARRGAVSIAFQAIGSGPLDIIFGAGLVSHLDLLWGDPRATDFLRGLGAMGRLLLFDKPGTGLSDPVAGPTTVEQRSEDFLAVLDAAGSRRCVVVGFSEASTPALLLAASHPDRVEALVVLSGGPRMTVDPGFLPELGAHLDATLWRSLNRAAEHWGDGGFLADLSPFVRHSALYRRLAPSAERASASPGMARVLIESMRSYDVTAILPTIRVPTLVVHRTDELVPVQLGRYVAEHVPNARMDELPGDEHMVFFAAEDVLSSIASFVGGRPAERGRSNRRLVTVLFTDIVGSTAQAAGLGDQRWRNLLEQHDRLVTEEVDRHEGRVVKHLGDGMLAAFDRPALAIRCASGLHRRMHDLGLQLRSGIHTGECELIGDDLAGIAVHVGARVAGIAQPGETLVTSTVRDLVLGSGVEFIERGVHVLEGVPQSWALSAVQCDRSRDQVPAVTATPAEAALSPPPSSSMRVADHVVLQLAARVPGLTRGALRVANRVTRTRLS